MMRLARQMIAACCLVLLTACSVTDIGAGFLNAGVNRDSFTVTSDISYGKHPRQKLDIYAPNYATKEPVIVFFYGGSWQKGSKEDYVFLAEAFTSAGYVTVIADYRLYPEIRYPEFIRDGASAATYVRNHIQRYGGDPNQIIVMGHSAGAYIALMLAADPRYLEEAGGTHQWIKAAIGIAGPYNFLPFTDDNIKDIFSTAPEKTVMPVNRVVGTPPPVFLATGDDDEVVDPRNSEQLKASLKRAGGTVVKKRYEGVGHIGIILSIADGFRHKTNLRADILTFLSSVRRQQAH